MLILLQREKKEKNFKATASEKFFFLVNLLKGW